MMSLDPKGARAILTEQHEALFPMILEQPQDLEHVPFRMLLECEKAAKFFFGPGHKITNDFRKAVNLHPRTGGKAALALPLPAPLQGLVDRLNAATGQAKAAPLPFARGGIKP